MFAKIHKDQASQLELLRHTKRAMDKTIASSKDGPDSTAASLASLVRNFLLYGTMGHMPLLFLVVWAQSKHINFASYLFLYFCLNADSHLRSWATCWMKSYWMWCLKPIGRSRTCGQSVPSAKQSTTLRMNDSLLVAWTLIYISFFLTVQVTYRFPTLFSDFMLHLGRCRNYGND